MSTEKKRMLELVSNELFNQLNIYFIDRIYRDIAKDESFDDSAKILSWYREHVEVANPLFGTIQASNLREDTDVTENRTKTQRSFCTVMKIAFPLNSSDTDENYYIYPNAVPYQYTRKTFIAFKKDRLIMTMKNIQSMAIDYITELIDICEDMIDLPDMYTSIQVEEYMPGILDIVSNVFTMQYVWCEGDVIRRPLSRISYVLKASKCINDLIDYVLGTDIQIFDVYNYIVNPVYYVASTNLPEVSKLIRHSDLGYVNTYINSEYMTLKLEKSVDLFVINLSENVISSINEEGLPISTVTDMFYNALLNQLSNIYASNIVRESKIILDVSSSEKIENDVILKGAVAGIASQVYTYCNSHIMAEII